MFDNSGWISSVLLNYGGLFIIIVFVPFIYYVEILFFYKVGLDKTKINLSQEFGWTLARYLMVLTSFAIPGFVVSMIFHILRVWFPEF